MHRRQTIGKFAVLTLSAAVFLTILCIAVPAGAFIGDEPANHVGYLRTERLEKIFDTAEARRGRRICSHAGASAEAPPPVEREFEAYGQIEERGIGREEALSRQGQLHAADHAVVARFFLRIAVTQQCRYRRLIVEEGGNAVPPPRHIHGSQHIALGCSGVNARLVVRRSPDSSITSRKI